MYSLMVHKVLPAYCGMEPYMESFFLSQLLSCHTFPITEPFSITRFEWFEMCNREPVWSEECASVMCLGTSTLHLLTQINPGLQIGRDGAWNLASSFSPLLKSVCFAWGKRALADEKVIGSWKMQLLENGKGLSDRIMSLQKTKEA